MNFDTLFIVLKMLFLNNSTGKIMKNFFNVTHRNGSKAVAIFFILMLVIGLIASLAGCGSDNPVGGNGNPPNNEVLIYSLDSFNINGTGSLQKDTIFNFEDSTYDSLKLTFEINSNCDTLDQALINISFGNSGIYYYYRDMNNSYAVYADKYNQFWLALLLKFDTNFNRYIRLKNIKLYLR